jgi:hypothetical protein
MTEKLFKKAGGFEVRFYGYAAQNGSAHDKEDAFNALELQIQQDPAAPAGPGPFAVDSAK